VPVLAAVAAVPLVLVVLVGAPIPRPFDGHTVLGARGLLDLFVIVAWVLWAIEVVVLVRATLNAVRGVVGERTPRWAAAMGARLAAACIVIGIGSGAGGLALGAGASPGSHPAVTAPATVPVPLADVRASPTATSAPTNPPVVPSTVTVEPGDSLWNLAQQLYGTGTDWQLLASANLGNLMVGGMRFTTPSLIYPGWQLVVPTLDPTIVASATTPVPVPAPALTPIPTPAGNPTPAVAPAPPTVTGAPHASAHPSAPTEADNETPEKAITGPSEGHRSNGARLPELVFLGIGALCAGVLARRVRWRRLWARIERRAGQVTVPLSEPAQAVAESLVAFADTPAPSVLAAALSHLTHAIRAEGIDVPQIRLVRVGPDGVALILAEERATAPGAYEVEAAGMAWVLPATLVAEDLPGAGDGEVWLPALLPVGDDQAGAYLVPVEPGETVAVVGSAAHEALAAMRAVAGAWEWADCQLKVTDEPVVAAAEAGLVETAPTVERIRVLYLGDAAALDLVTRSKVGMVSREARRTTGVVVECETGVTALEPFGLVLVPAGFVSEQAAAMEELLASAAMEPVDPVTPVTQDAARVPEQEAVQSVRFPHPGPREARVLTPSPRIEGDIGEGPAARRARAIELFCYLALAGRAVPPEKLLMEALASPTGDAAPKTLRNMAAELRTWVGAEYVPSAKGTGYRVDASVTSDLGRLREAVALARQTDDEEERIALLRPALDLIEGRPASETRSGWGWWTLYDSQAKDAASDAAQMLAPLLAARGDRQGARWAIDQARIVEDCSEALSRVAMECGGAVGDAGWVERELRAWEKKMDELFPGATPTEEAYETYRTVMASFGVPT
jgi:hypothetical protein